MDKISELIKVRIRQHQLGSSAFASEVVHHANQFIARRLKCESDEVRAIQLKSGILFVETASAAWGQELWSVHDELLRKLQIDFGEKAVQKIRTKSLTSS